MRLVTKFESHQERRFVFLCRSSPSQRDNSVTRSHVVAIDYQRVISNSIEFRWNTLEKRIGAEDRIRSKHLQVVSLITSIMSMYDLIEVTIGREAMNDGCDDPVGWFWSFDNLPKEVCQ